MPSRTIFFFTTVLKKQTPPPTPKGYPNPEDLEIPDPGDISPDQTYAFGWIIQHARLWLACLGLFLALLASIALNIVQAVRYRPVVVWYEFQSGYLVAYNERGEQMIDGVVYRPGPLRAVVRNFIENRYGYDWRDLNKINSAIRYLSPEAVPEEQKKIQEAELGSRIYSVRATWRLELDMDRMQVQALGKGRFRVRVPGTAYINDALNYPDPAKPYPKPFIAEVTVATVPATETNPWGYQIVGTGRDIIY